MNNRETIQELADLFIGGGFECETGYSCAAGSSAIIRFGSFSMIRYIV